MPVNSSEFARFYHERTKHSWGSVGSLAHALDWANQPLPFKAYPTLQPIPLPVDLPERELSAARALLGPAPGASEPLDLRELARLLFFSCGVTRPLRWGGRWLHFRAAPSAGALYPVEVYAVCADLPELAAGVYHFAPVEFALRRLRAGDFRRTLADAAAEPVVGRAAATLVLTGIPWRTTWKYLARGYRHLYWDAGAILANLLALADAAAVPARVLAGFADAAVARLLDLGNPEEFPLAVVPLATAGPAPAPSPPVERLGLPVAPLSSAPVDDRLVSQMQQAGALAGPDELEGWRRAAAGLPASPAPGQAELPGTAKPGDTIESVILRRGSTRRFRLTPIPAEGLTWPLAVAARPVPADFVAPGGTLLEHLLVVHDVQGVAPGAYRWRQGELLAGRRGRFRRQAAYLCLEQGLGGDGAYTVFHCARLQPVLAGLGARGYRAAQLEAGIAAGRLQLAAFALGFGATGLTFYDDDVSRFFTTDAAPMLVTAVGVPAYRSRPGTRPALRATGPSVDGAAQGAEPQRSPRLGC